MLTYSEVKQLISKYAQGGGKCPKDAEVDMFVRTVMKYLLNKGPAGSERTFLFYAKDGCLTLPYELETPLKVKMGGQVGQVWSKWFEYRSMANDNGCLLAEEALQMTGIESPTIYDLPTGGAFVGALATCQEDADAHVIIKGFDVTGREVFTNHKGEKIVGEYLSLKKGSIRRTSVQFGAITEVFKTTTKGYVNLLWVSPDQLTKGFLADYSPVEETPSYRKAKLKFSNLRGVQEVSIIGRIRLKNYYADNDVVPFDNPYALQLAAKAIQSDYNNQIDAAVARNNILDTIVEQEQNYKRPNTGQPLDMMVAKSGGAIRRTIRGGRY